jgi:hypothetical protein
MKNHISSAVLITITLLLTASPAYGGQKPPKPPKPPKVPATVVGTITLTDQTWVCDGPVNLDAVNVTITPAVDKKNRDAVHLRPGCTGRIGLLNVSNSYGDAVKVAEGAHDLTIAGGTIQCPAKAPTLHQDGVQVMGGQRITFQNMVIDCGRAADSLIDSNFFVNQAGQSTAPPSDVVCDHCTLGGWTAHTTNIQTSVRSGIRNSTLCVGRFPKLTVTIATNAVDAVNSGNVVKPC